MTKWASGEEVRGAQKMHGNARDRKPAIYLAKWSVEQYT
jgi:hypothetical protein